jgi:hypothetical protein
LLLSLVGAPVVVGKVRVGLSPYLPEAVGRSVPAGRAGPVVAAAEALGAAADAEADGLVAELGADVVAVAVGVADADADALPECVLPLAQAESAVVRASELASTRGKRRTRRPQAFGEEKCG